MHNRKLSHSKKNDIFITVSADTLFTPQGKNESLSLPTVDNENDVSNRIARSAIKNVAKEYSAQEVKIDIEQVDP